MRQALGSVRGLEGGCGNSRVVGCLDTKRELDANVDVSCHLDNLGELYTLLRSILKVVDGEDLEAGFVDLLECC